MRSLRDCLPFAWPGFLAMFLTCGLSAAPPGDASRTYGGKTLPEWRELIKSTPLPALAVPETIDGLIEIVADPQAPWVDRRQVALTLGRIGPPAANVVPVLRSILNHDPRTDAADQLWALKALALLGPSGNPAQPEVAALLRSSAAPHLLRATAMETLARVAPDDAGTLSLLIQQLQADTRMNDPVAAHELRIAAAVALRILGPTALPALPELLRGCRSPWTQLRLHAVQAIGDIGPRAEIAIPTLMDLVLFDEAGEVREAAADALGRMGPPARGSLRQLSVDEDATVRRFALRGWSQPAMRDICLPQLRAAIEDSSAIVRVEAAAAGLSNDLATGEQRKAFVDTLLTGLRSDDREARLASYRTLRAHPDVLKEISCALETLSQDPNISNQTRRAAEQLLSRMRAESSSPADER